MNEDLILDIQQEEYSLTADVTEEVNLLNQPLED